jgi:hypothetical protein
VPQWSQQSRTLLVWHLYQAHRSHSESVGAWTERFSHIDDHFMARQGIQDWVLRTGTSQNRKTIDMKPRDHIKFAVSRGKAAIGAARESDLEMMRHLENGARESLRRPGELRKWICETPS